MEKCTNGECHPPTSSASNEVNEDGSVKSLQQLCREAEKEFRKKFARSPTHCSYAPGRVVLSGEHVDYSDGFVLPMAIPLYTVIVGVADDDSNGICQIMSTSIPEDENYIEIDLKTKIKPGKPIWANYVRGVLALYKNPIVPFKAVIHSSLPLGGGLSSSAALEVAMLYFVECLSTGGKPILSLKEKAVLCEKAEHDYAGVMCGIMDQYISTMANQKTALLIDCRSLESKYIPLDNDNLVLLVADTLMKHELNGVHAQEFIIRHDACLNAAKLLDKPALRDVSIDELLDNADKLGQTMFKRAKFAVTEILRTRNAAKAVIDKNWVEFGAIMCQGHESLRDDYEVSCVELNKLVQLALECQGVYGSRLTGGGFGGCTVTLIDRDECKNCMKHIRKFYDGPLRFYICEAVDGADSFIINGDRRLK